NGDPRPDRRRSRGGALRVSPLLLTGVLRPRQPLLPRLGSDRPRCGDARRVAEGVGLRPGVAPGLRGEVGRRTLGPAPAQRSPLGVGQLRDVRVSAPRTTPTQAAGGAAGWSKSEMMIVASARQLEGERVCFVGIGLPN